MKILTWEDLAENTIFKSYTEEDFVKLVLKFKPGKNMSDLVEAVQNRGVKNPFDTEAMIAQRENILKEFFEGNLKT